MKAVKPISKNDIVVIEPFTNATLYRVVNVIDDEVEVAVVKWEGDDLPSGVHPMSDFFHLNTKQKEEHRERLQNYRTKINRAPD